MIRCRTSEVQGLTAGRGMKVVVIAASVVPILVEDLERSLYHRVLLDIRRKRRRKRRARGQRQSRGEYGGRIVVHHRQQKLKALTRCGQHAICQRRPLTLASDTIPSTHASE